ncbi:MAG: AMP-binding protein [Alphaproteobacteria bacterium]|nr:AMP-binding protein [Alphaproteobacteria bacterium]MDE2014036.1 AMP-binding protein [Alphaproteobacteria bacterium]MDE2074554.1 AMP-binding protein [Alphaproteobacteria bacterium]
MSDELSVVRGADGPPLLDLTIGRALEAAVGRWGEREAIVSVHQNVRLTYRQLRDRAEAVACGLLALGLKPGDRVGIWSPNNAEWAITQFATALAGMILVNINPAYRTAEAEYTLNKVGVKALVAAESFKTSRYLEMVEALAPEIAQSKPGALKAEGLPQLSAVIRIGGGPRAGWLDFEVLAKLGGAGEQAALAKLSTGLDCTDAINIQFTSGTTGLPKGATLSHRNVLNNGYFVGRAIGLREGDRLCIPVPLYHCFGMVMGNLACLVHGATMIYPAAGFEPLAVLETVATERCTGLYGVPTMFIAEMGHPDFARYDLTTLRTGIMAGAPCPVEVMKAVMERMNMRDITIAYGMTETSPVSFQTSTDDPIARRVSTVGRIQPHLEAKVIDADGGTVPRGVAGELLVRGYSVMKGYWEDVERTAEAVDAEGWMHTGDLADIDAEGYCRIVGRVKDMVIRGGENIYPREVEEYLYRHPAIEDVQVFGVPDEKYGEELCAWIKLRSGHDVTEEDFRAFCRERIAHYKVPRYILFVDEFPMTATGKIQKFVMRKAMAERLANAQG